MAKTHQKHEKALSFWKKNYEIVSKDFDKDSKLKKYVFDLVCVTQQVL
jgi:hypothetical protein